MKKYTLPSLCLIAVTVLGASSRGAVILDDQFTSLNVSTWTATNSPGAITPSIPVDTDSIRFRVTSTNANQRTFITSTSNNLNPFSAPLQVSLSGLSLGSAAPSGSGSSMFFAIIGLADGDVVSSYFPTVEGSFQNYDAEGSGALGLTVQSTSGGLLLQVFDYGSGTNSNSVSLGLNGVPTDISWTINGTGENKTWEVLISGTTFANDSTTLVGTFSRFNLNETDVSRLSLGAINYGGAGGSYANGTTYTLDAVTVSTIPEPAAAVLVSGVLILGATLTSRRSIISRKKISAV